MEDTRMKNKNEKSVAKVVALAMAETLKGFGERGKKLKEQIKENERELEYYEEKEKEADEEH
jgi:hypothetical protein